MFRRLTYTAASLALCSGLAAPLTAHAACAADPTKEFIEGLAQDPAPIVAKLATKYFPGGHAGHLLVPLPAESASDQTSTGKKYRVLLQNDPSLWYDATAEETLGLIRQGAPAQGDAGKPARDQLSREFEHATVASATVVKDSAGKKSLDLEVVIPSSTRYLWEYRSLWVIACDDKASGDAARWTPYAYARARVSNAPISLTAGILVTLLLLVTVSKCVATAQARLGDPDAPTGLRALRPRLLMPGPNGRASLAMFQLTLFTTVVSLLMWIYLFSTGNLSALSHSVAMLLGIVATGSVAGSYVNQNLTAIDSGNVMWMIDRRFLPARGTRLKPTFRDLVTTAGNFDVYRFQTIAFTLFVAAALLVNGFSGLSDFTIDANLLTLLGFSQVAYVAGKTVAPKMDELNKALTAVVDKEKELRTALDNKEQAGTVVKNDEHIAALLPAEYPAYEAAFFKADDLFRQIFGEPAGEPAGERAGVRARVRNVAPQPAVTVGQLRSSKPDSEKPQ